MKTSVALKKRHENHKKEPVKNEEYITGNLARLDEECDQISNLEDKIAENTQSEEQKEKIIFKNEGGLWDNIKRNNICVINIPEGEQGEQERENLLEEIITENFLTCWRK